MNSIISYLQKMTIALMALLMVNGNLFSQQKKGNSEWVYPGKDGKLIYKTTSGSYFQKELPSEKTVDKVLPIFYSYFF